MYEWEESKENIRPLSSGRNIETLNQILGHQNENEIKEKITEHAQKFENEILAYTGDDPLDNWIKYIKWAEQISVNNVNKIKLSTLYQRCLTECKKFARYCNDERYVHIFVDYAKKYDSNRINIFNWMYKHKCGNELSDFYISWSECLEEAQLFQQAKQVLELGLNERAQPHLKLRSYYENFQKRAAIKLTTQANMNIIDDNMRQALYQLEMITNKDSRYAPVDRSMAHAPTVMQISSNEPQTRGKKLDIYIPDAKLSSINESNKTDKAAKMPFEIEVNKENSMNPDKWCNYSISAKTRRIDDSNQKSASDVPIYTDNDSKHQLPHKLPQSSASNADNDNDSNCKRRLAFVYKLTKPNENENVEFQFEELRARHYYKLYEIESKKDREIEELKKKLEKFQLEKQSTGSTNTDHKMNEAATNTTVSLKDLTTKFDTKSMNRPGYTTSTMGTSTNNYTQATSKTTNDFTCVTNDNNFTNVSLISSFTKPYDKRSVDNDSTNWTMLKPPSTSMYANTTTFPTPKNVTMHTKMARQDVNALFGTTTDTSANTTSNCSNVDLKSIAIHNDFENTNQKDASEAQFSIFHDPTLKFNANDENNYKNLPRQPIATANTADIKSNNENGSIFIYEGDDETRSQPKPTASTLKQQIHARKPLNLIAEVDLPIKDKENQVIHREDDDDSESTIDNKFAHLNEQYTAKLCFNPAAASTMSIKPLLEQMKSVKFSQKLDSFEEISVNDITKTMNAGETINEKDTDHLSKIIEEDFQTQYGWSKLMHNSEQEKQQQQQQNQKKSLHKQQEIDLEDNRVPLKPAIKLTDVNNKDICESPFAIEGNTTRISKYTNSEIKNNTTFTTSPAISWDYNYMDIGATGQALEQQQKAKKQPSQESDIQDIKRPLEYEDNNLLNTQKLIGFNNDLSNADEINKEKFVMQNQNYQLCTDISSTSVNATVTAADGSITTTCMIEKSQLIKIKINDQTENQTEIDNKSRISINASKLINNNVTYTNNVTLPDLELPPDMTMTKEKSILFSQQVEKQVDDVAEQVDNELLTAEKFDQTMTINFRKCFSVIAAATEGILNGSASNLCKPETSVLNNNGILHTQPLPNLSRFQNFNENNSNDSFSMITTSLKTTDLLHLRDPTQSLPSLNDTLVNAIKEPFNIDFKNRLLMKKQDYLNGKTNYMNIELNMPSAKPGLPFLLDSQPYKILKEVGSGAYAKIFIMELQSKKSKRVALKVSKQATAWEFYVTEVLHERLKEIQSKIIVENSFIRILQFTKYDNGSICTMHYYQNGTLLDLINYHVKSNQSFPYWFVIYLVLETLSIINYLHKSKIIHCDIKPDNMMINELPKSINYFDPSRTKCLVLIDFNRSIDLNMFPEETEFDAKANNKSLLCCEMKTDRPWTYQLDYFGMLSSIHCIIFKKYLKPLEENNRFRTTSSFPRNYDRIFSTFFDTYLNIPSCKSMPDLETEWIPKFVGLFRNEMVNFTKSEKYLNDLNNSLNK